MANSAPFNYQPDTPKPLLQSLLQPYYDYASYLSIFKGANFSK